MSFPKRSNNTATSKDTNNAFAVLMGHNKKSKRTKSSSASRFVLCPAGCGKHILDAKVNEHLDRCIADQQQQSKMEETKRKQQPLVSQEVSEKVEPAKTPRDTGAQSRRDHPEDIVQEATEESVEDYKKQVTPDQASLPNKVPNVFAHMMEQSKTVFSQKEKPPLQQRFHLRSNGADVLVSFGEDALQLDHTMIEPVQWSATVRVRSRLGTATSESLKLQKVELSITSSIPSYVTQTPTRLVRRHSRLSVPVLKSILQKCIRRRKPLPAVRVAMELMDKSMGDLLRRLPVIVLEDSALHPDFGLLVWAMIAHSKDFVLPPQLVVRILEIMFEVAACQWSDALVDDNHEGTNDLSLAQFHNATIDPQCPDKAKQLVWSMLVRAEYGGMKGDVRMLQSYAGLWNQRFAAGSAPDLMASRIHGTDKDESSSRVLSWSDVPALIHASAKGENSRRVPPLCTNGIDRLEMDDICFQGIDFHCSAVLDYLLSDRALVGVYQDLEVLSKGSNWTPGSLEGQRSWLEGILKRCMWTYSSGVNRRLPLSPETEHAASSNKDEQMSYYANLWNELVAPRVLEFQHKYVRDRLAR